MSARKGAGNRPRRIPRRLELVPIKYAITGVTDIYIEERPPSGWCIVSLGEVLNSKLEWEYEPSPSNRSDGFKKRTRYRTVVEALKVYEQWERASQSALLRAR